MAPSNLNKGMVDRACMQSWDAARLWSERRIRFEETEYCCARGQRMCGRCHRAIIRLDGAYDTVTVSLSEALISQRHPIRAEFLNFLIESDLRRLLCVVCITSQRQRSPQQPHVDIHSSRRDSRDPKLPSSAMAIHSIGHGIPKAGHLLSIKGINFAIPRSPQRKLLSGLSKLNSLTCIPSWGSRTSEHSESYISIMVASKASPNSTEAFRDRTRVVRRIFDQFET
jgi:hypothetical protein